LKILHQEMPEVSFLQGTEALYFLFEVIIIVIVSFFCYTIVIFYELYIIAK